MSNPNPPDQQSGPWTTPQDLYVHILEICLRVYEEGELVACGDVNVPNGDDTRQHGYFIARVLNHMCANIRHPRSPKERNWLFEEAKISHALTNISPALTNILGRLLKKDMGCAEDLGAFSDRLRDKNAITTHGVTTALERQTIMSLGFIFYTVKMER